MDKKVEIPIKEEKSLINLLYASLRRLSDTHNTEGLYEIMKQIKLLQKLLQTITQLLFQLCKVITWPLTSLASLIILNAKVSLDV